MKKLEELRGIAKEIEEARDNMQGTNFENTERYQLYDEVANILSQAVDGIESAINNAGDDRR